MFIKKFSRLFAVFVSILSTQTSHALLSNHQESIQQAQVVNAPKEIAGKIVTLRKLKVDYFREYYEIFSPLIRDSIECSRASTIIEIYLDLFKKMRLQACGQTFSYCIFNNADNKLIGFIEIRDKNHSVYGQFACWINEKYWGGGRFKEAATLISDAYFSQCDAKSYTAHVRPWNGRSYRALIKFGFQYYGTYRLENGAADRYVLEHHRPQAVLSSDEVRHLNLLGANAATECMQ